VKGLILRNMAGRERDAGRLYEKWLQAVALPAPNFLGGPNTMT